MIRSVLAAILLATAAASAAWLTVKHFRQSGLPPAPTALERTSPLRADRLVVTCFRTNNRCDDCVHIEDWSREAVQTAFAEQMADGRLEWTVINFDVPEHRHFAAEYQLVAPSLVLVAMHQATPGRHVYCGEVWNLIHDKAAFIRYVQEEVRRFETITPAAASSAPPGYWIALLLACWLGLQTAISPCPLSTNIAAISFLSRRPGGRNSFAAGVLYAIGRSLAYVAVAGVLVTGLAANAGVSAFLRRGGSVLLGPLLIVAAVLLLDLLRLGFATPEISPAFHRRVQGWGLPGALLLGILFALAFCPYSAALFFSLIPLATRYDSWILMPALYGLATALPVIVFAAIIALGVRSLGNAFDRLSQFERAGRWIAGLVFLGLGVYLTIRQM
jgi:cytochrome c biogenesis protein CcdA